MKEDKGDIKEEGINVNEVLKAIEECIHAYWMFVKTDSKKSWWKFSSSLWSNPPVEDPRDVELLADLTKRLRKVIKFAEIKFEALTSNKTMRNLIETAGWFTF